MLVSDWSSDVCSSDLQDMQAIIHATKKHYREVGFIYLCNPNNPTGRVVSKQEVRTLLDGIPEDMPVLIDEAYHHFVLDSKIGRASCRETQEMRTDEEQ